MTDAAPDAPVPPQVAAWMARAERVTVLTGAGCSTDSGIPDFRGPQGVWTRNPAAQALFTIDAYVSDPQVRITAWQERSRPSAWTATPNEAHRALAALQDAGRLRALVTQNIDGLHQAAGSRDVVELHGTLWWARCLACGDRIPMREALDRVAAGEADPPCWACGGILKSDTVSFGQSLDPDVLAAAARAAADCDLFLAVGTSLQVHPAAGLCDVAVRRGARLVIVNAESTPYDVQADAVLRAPIGVAVPALVAAALATP